MTIKATALDGSGVYGEVAIAISNQIVLVENINVTGEGNSTSITSNGGTLQMLAEVLPADATTMSVLWSITDGFDHATIDPSTGLLTATGNGTVTVRATALDGSGVYGEAPITISGQFVPVNDINVTGENGKDSIDSDGGTMQMYAEVLPADATNKKITWSIATGTEYATISESGLLTAAGNGKVTVWATAQDGSEVYGIAKITITGQTVLVNDINVTGAGGETSIKTKGGTLQMFAEVLPADASNKSVVWSIFSGPEYATIDGSGLLTAIGDGMVIVRATAQDGTDIYGSIVIGIAGQKTNWQMPAFPVTSITISVAGGAASITDDGGTLQMIAEVFPSNASNKNVKWSLADGSEYATISGSGLLKATGNGSVTIRATATDGSGVFGEMTVTISGQTGKENVSSPSTGDDISVPLAVALFAAVVLAGIGAGVFLLRMGKN